MKIEIKSWLTGSVLFEGDFSCLADAVKAAVARSANLSYANLSYANLSYANLRSANLSYANLRSANLRSANLSYAVHSWAQVAFMGHGDCGRMLTAIQIKKTDSPAFFCGCFTGDEQALRAYIAGGDARLRKTRTIAVDTVITLLSARNDE